MILVITNNTYTKRIIEKYISLKNIVLEDNIDNLNMYIDKELMSKNIEYFDKIIIDISNIEQNDEIYKGILRLKTIYDIQIIVIALKYKVGNKLLSRLFDIGIYDFVISEDKKLQDEEIRKALNGNTYIESIHFKLEDEEKKKNKKSSNYKKEQVRKKKILACFSFIKNSLFIVFKLISYILIMFLMSVGATALINSNIREMLIKILQGG